MGWKSIKDHYRIEHIVQVTETGICIGSQLSHALIVIGLDGAIKKRYEGGFAANADLKRYQAEMDADPAKLASLVRQQDRFDASIPVYTFEGDQILEKQCEALGYPNVTHDGELMYENTFSTDRQQVVRWALRRAWGSIESRREMLQEAREQLARREALLQQAETRWANLAQAHPEAAAEVERPAQQD